MVNEHRETDGRRVGTWSGSSIRSLWICSSFSPSLGGRDDALSVALIPSRPGDLEYDGYAVGKWLATQTVVRDGLPGSRSGLAVLLSFRPPTRHFLVVLKAEERVGDLEREVRFELVIPTFALVGTDLRAHFRRDSNVGYGDRRVIKPSGLGAQSPPAGVDGALGLGSKRQDEFPPTTLGDEWSGRCVAHVDVALARRMQ